MGYVLACVAIHIDIRDVGSGDFFSVETFPIDFSKPHMGENIAAAAVQITKTFREIGREQRLKKIFRTRLEERRVVHLASEDLFIQLDGVAVFSVERRVASHHLEKQHTHRPPVHTGIVSASADYLRRQVVRRATERPAHTVGLGRDFGKPKVDELQVSVSTDQHVFRLQIAVDDVVFVQEVNRKRHFRDVEFRHLGWESPALP